LGGFDARFVISLKPFRDCMELQCIGRVLARNVRYVSFHRIKLQFRGIFDSVLVLFGGVWSQCQFTSTTRVICVTSVTGSPPACQASASGEWRPIAPLLYL
jgi:hypothetical protein